MTKMIHNTDNNLFHRAFAKSNAPINVNLVEGGGGGAVGGRFSVCMRQRSICF